MGEEFASEACFTCCKKSTHFLKISDSDGDSMLNIHRIMCQHFWFKEEDLQSAIVCESCWEKVNQFHQFYLDVKKLHEHREVAPLSMFIKQEEITIEETQLQENCINLSAENQKLFDIADCKHEITEDFDEPPKTEETKIVFSQTRKIRKYVRRQPRKLPTLAEQQMQDDFIKQHTLYICDECGTEFTNFRAIKYHRKKAHKMVAFVCCGVHHRSRARLYQHVQSLLNPEAFKCEICEKSFKYKITYVRHKELFHAAEKDLVFKCNRCPKSFIKEGLLKGHLAKHETLEKETAKCQFCGKCFHTQDRLNRHVKSVHKEPTDFICEVCSKGFHERGLFLAHHKTHELTAEQLKEQCPVCRKWLNNHSNWLQHMRRHKRVVPLKEQCPVCNKWLSNHSNWLQHMRRHKGGEFQCEVCSHTSSNMTSLKRHIKARHAPDRMIHECEQCGKEYSMAYILKEHVAYVHTREHPYQCQHCDKKFFFRTAMYSHRQKNHPQEWLEDHASKNVRREEVLDGGEMANGISADT